jgi:protein ImuA
MTQDKEEILRQLYREILPLQGYKAAARGTSIDMGLGPIQSAFPNGTFPTGAIHDFITNDEEQDAATSAYVATLLGRLTASGGLVAWIGQPDTILTPGLPLFGLEPHRVFFVRPPSVRAALWVLEETLRCEKFIGVIAEIGDLTATESRRLQLVVEKSGVTGFLIRRRRKSNNVLCIARWKITALPSRSQGQRPGKGFPCWKVELLRVRNGTPCAWMVEWTGSELSILDEQATGIAPGTRKTG